MEVTNGIFFQTRRPHYLGFPYTPRVETAVSIGPSTCTWPGRGCMHVLPHKCFIMSLQCFQTCRDVLPGSGIYSREIRRDRFVDQRGQRWWKPGFRVIIQRGSWSRRLHIRHDPSRWHGKKGLSLTEALIAYTFPLFVVPFSSSIRENTNGVEDYACQHMVLAPVSNQS